MQHQLGVVVEATRMRVFREVVAEVLGVDDTELFMCQANHTDAGRTSRCK